MRDKGVPEPATLAEIEAMSPDEAVTYAQAGGDLSAVLAVATPVTEVGERPDELPMMVTSLRLPVPMYDRLNKLAGRDRDGRSGVIRQAVEEFFARLDEAA